MLHSDHHRQVLPHKDRINHLDTLALQRSRVQMTMRSASDSPKSKTGTSTLFLSMMNRSGDSWTDHTAWIENRAGHFNPKLFVNCRVEPVHSHWKRQPPFSVLVSAVDRDLRVKHPTLFSIQPAQRIRASSIYVHPLPRWSMK